MERYKNYPARITPSETKRVSEGHTGISLFGEPLRSVDFMSCHAVLVTAPALGLNALSHVTEIFGPREDERHKHELELLGTGFRQARVVVGESSDTPNKSINILRELGIDVLPDIITVPTYNTNWSLTFSPLCNRASVNWSWNSRMNFTVFPPGIV